MESVTGSVFVREKGMGATNRNCAGSQVITRTFVSLDFQRKKWKRLLGEKHSKALLFWPSKEGSIIGFSEGGSKKGRQQSTHFFTVHICTSIQKETHLATCRHHKILLRKIILLRKKTPSWGNEIHNFEREWWHFSPPNRISLHAFLTIQNALRSELTDDPYPLQQLK